MAIKLEDGEEIDLLDTEAGTSSSGGYQMPDFGMGGGSGLFDGGLDFGGFTNPFESTEPDYGDAGVFSGGTNLIPTFNMVQQGEGGGGVTTTDTTGNIVTLPNYVVNEPRDTGGALSSIFNPNPIIGADAVGERGIGGELSGAIPAISSGAAPGVVGVGSGVSKTIPVGDTQQTIVFDDVINRELNKEIALMKNQGISTSDPQFSTRLEAAANRALEIYNSAQDLGRYTNLEPTPGSSQQTGPGRGGPPIILPIAGLSPATAAILTAAGLIFSGGKIARLDKSDPVGSVVGAVQGVGQTGQNVVDVATGKTTIPEIWSPGSTGAPSGSSPTGTTPTSTGTGASVGEGEDAASTSIGSTPIFGGGLSGAGGGAAAGAGGTMGAGQTTTGGTPVVTPGSLGGDSSAAVSSPASLSAAQAAQQQSMAGAVAAAAARQQAADDASKISGGQSGTASGPEMATSSSVPGLFGGGQPGVPAKPVTWGGQSAQAGDTTAVSRPPGLLAGIPSSGPASGSQTGTANESSATSNPPPSVMPTTPTTPSSTSTGTGTASTFIINPIAGGYTLPTAGTPVARNLYQEASTTTQALGTPMQRAVIGKDAAGNDILGNVPIDPSTGQPMTVSQGIAAGYGGLARGMTQEDMQNLLSAIVGQGGGASLAKGQGYNVALTDLATEQTRAANRALRSGNIADAEALAQQALNIRNQANQGLFGAQGVLPQFTQTAQEQVGRDVAALRRAEAGELSPEEIRNAQQAAREAYAARGQVYSQGAAAQEVLNRQAAVQQRQQLARQNLAQSMGQLGQGVGYQTANIFDPFATTLGAQYGMQTQNVGMNQALYNQAMGLSSGAGGYGFAQQMINPFSGYAQDVYSMNVNALNDAMNAQANRQAALEAAKMGQTGEYAKALGTLITTGGLDRIQSGLSSGIQGVINLLGGKWPGSSTMITPTVSSPGT